MWGILNDAFTQFHVLTDESFSVFIKCWEGRLTVRMGVRLRLCVAVRTHQLACKYFSNLPNYFLYYQNILWKENHLPVGLTPVTRSYRSSVLEFDTQLRILKFTSDLSIEIDKSCSFPLKCNFIEVEAEQSWVKGKSYFRFTRQ